MQGHNQIWMSIDNDDGSMKEGFQIPYNPESFTITEGTNEKTVQVAGAGSVIVKNGKSPVTITFSAFFSPVVEPGLELENEGDLKSPKEYDALLRKWKNGSKPVHLVVTNTNVNTYFSISTYTTTEEGGDVGKIKYTLSLKQYGTASGLDGTDDGTGATSGTGMVRRIGIETHKCPDVPDTYIVQKGDTLDTIAKYFYNDLSMKYEIYKLNTAKLKKGVNTKLKKKWVLYLPKPSS